MAAPTNLARKLRQRLARKPTAPRQDLSGRSFLVTGAAEDSLGHATASVLLQWGAEVIVTRRRGSERLASRLAADAGEDAGRRVSGHDLDLADAGSVERFASWMRSSRETLDVLVNCAGIHLDLLSRWSEPRLSDDGFEVHWRTNYLGTTHLTRRLLPLLRESARRTGDARVVTVVSMLHSRGRNAEFFEPTRPYGSWDAYGQSKLGLIHFTMELHRRYGAQGLHAYCLHPGEVFTNVATAGLAGHPLIESLRNVLSPVEALFLMTPLEGAQTQLLCATGPRVEGGHYYRNCAIARASEDARDAEVASRLWDANEAWVASL
ncbi:MAG: SDR family NAD(P)-dependent oxidoreductase [Myxococcota bacterium]